ncbi:MAG: BBP7 family outer membrane beta-barrel protein [Planctomycetota bacterium]
MAKTTVIAMRAFALAGLLLTNGGLWAQELPAPTGMPAPMSMDATPAPNIELTPTPPADASILSGTPAQFGPAANGYELPDAIAPVETTGTWLDRGYWYCQAEAVAMVRQWNRQRLILAGDGTILLGPTGAIAGFSQSNRNLSLGRSTPGREGSVRFTLGRFLFRDNDNRDHSAEFTVFGGGEYGQNSEVVTAIDPTLGGTGMQVLTGTDLNALESFDGAESMAIQYDSRINSFEMNYVISTRLNRDRMELMPTGEWVRRANSGLTYKFLGGLRYIDLTENVAWSADNIFANAFVPTGANGLYDVRTSNDMFGVQGGFACAYQGSRWSLTTTGKLAALANDLKTRAGLSYTEGDTGDVIDDISSSNSNRTDTISMLGELSVIGRLHLRPNISWRTGYRMMYVTHVALAPHQLDFQPDDARVNSTGDIFYHGLSTGLDFYW